MTLRFLSKSCWILRAAAVGLGLGVLAHLTLPMKLTLHKSGAPTPSSPAPATRALACYALRLGELGTIVDRFAKSTFDDTSQLKEAARPMIEAITRMNDSYDVIYKSGPELTVNLLRSSERNADRDKLICAMQKANNYQWEEMRPRLNKLLVNIVWAWRDDLEPDRLGVVRSEQKSGWRDLRDRLRQGADDFGQGPRVDPCGPVPGNR